ncbi:putative monooxygenase [Rosellinia necatrix]|uniref:Putative monooxygenase n=1 Tax=Rosellinia necatrix TaxID=77044 RepID=A0A1W2TQY1_ROSNE|nr:putative monooxygenase [Rosellinia necatrix]
MSTNNTTSATIRPYAFPFGIAVLVVGSVVSFLQRWVLKRQASVAAGPVHPLKTLALDTEAITTRYQAEREKRLRQDGVDQFKQTKGKLSRFKDDVSAPLIPRKPVKADVKVVICGAGFAGLATAVKLKDQGVKDIAIIDKGAGFGGTWYWNNYPGAACDVESYMYLPFLEETGYIPKDRFSYGPEIREQVARVVAKWDLEKNAYLSTAITSMVWDEPLRRWHVRTNHNDHFISQFVVLATGTFHEPKLPGIPGIEDFQRHHFHSGRWDYGFTGGDPTGNMTKLADKKVGIIGTGASAVQLVPHLAKCAKKLYVFQRTPSSIGLRANTKTDPNMAASLKPGWQQEMMDVFADIMQGELSEKECTGVEGLEALTVREIYREGKEAGATISPQELPELFQLADFRLMDKLRKLVGDIVKDSDTAEKLKPWYSFMCKRPAFHNDYLGAFNNPNVELVDTEGQGVSYLTKTGVVANNKEYEVDLLVYSTGFDFETGVDFYRRTGIKLVGSRGRGLDEAWSKKGPSTLFGLHIREFPNLFYIGPAQAGVTANWTHTTYVAGQHIAETVAAVIRDGSFQAIEPTEEAEEDWGKQIDEGAEMRVEFAKLCPPGYYNKEGKPGELPARLGYFPKGIMMWTRILKEWREEGTMKGMEKR